MAWNISTAKRRALVKLQLRDKNGRWIEMGGGVKWYSSKRKKVIAGTVVGSQGEYALVRLNKENPTHEPALVKVPANSIAVVDSKAKISIPGKNAPADATPEFEKPKAVGLQPNKPGSFVKPSDSPEDYTISETADGRTYISRPDGAELYFPARSLDIGDEIIAIEGTDDTKPFSIGKGWGRKKAEAVKVSGPKMGTVIDINGDRYAVIQLADGVVVDDPKRPGEKTNKVTVGLSNSVVKATDGLKQALGGIFDDEGFSEDDATDEEEVDASEEANSDHVGREVPEDEEAVEEDPAADVDVDIAEATKAAEPGADESDEDAPIREEEDPEAKAAAEAELARRVAEREAKRKELGDQYDENGLTADEAKMVSAYDRLAAGSSDPDRAANYFDKAEALRETGKKRLGEDEKPAEKPKEAPQSAPEPEEERQSDSEDSEAPTEKSEAEKQFEAIQDEIRDLGQDDPKRKAAESATDNATDSEREGTKQYSDEWYDIWNSTYGAALEDNKAEDDAQARQQAQDEPVNHGEGMPTLFSKTLRGNTRSEMEYFDEVARESEVDQGYRMNGNKFEVYDRDRALAAVDNAIDIWEDKEASAKGGGYVSDTPAKIRAVLKGLNDLNEALKADKEEADGRTGRFNNGYDIKADTALRGLKENSEEQDYVVTTTSDALIEALPIGSTVTTLDDERYDAQLPYVKIDDNTWARSKGIATRDWDIYLSRDMVDYDITTGIRLPDHEMNDFTEREMEEARQAAERKRKSDAESDERWKAHQESLKAEKESKEAPAEEEAPKKEQAPLEEGEQFELPLPGVKKQGKRDDKSEAHKKTLDGLEKGDRVSYTNAHDEEFTFQKHEDGTWDLLDPEDDWEDQSPLEEALTSDEVAARAKRRDLEVSTVADQEEAEREENYKRRLRGDEYMKSNPDPVRRANNGDEGQSRAEQEAQDANAADQPWSAEEIQGTMRDWFDFAQAVKNGDNRAINTMANNKRTGDEETDIIVNDKGQPFDLTLTYNDDGDPVVRLSNFDDSKDIFGDFEIDSSVMPKHLATLIHESINADDIRAAIAERNGSNDPADEEGVGQSYEVSSHIGEGKNYLAKAMEDHGDSGIVINGTTADVTDLDKAQDFLRDAVLDIQGKISDPAARKNSKVELNKAQRNLNKILADVNAKQFQRDGVIRKPKWARDAEEAKAEEESNTTEESAPEAPEAPEADAPEAEEPEAEAPAPVDIVDHLNQNAVLGDDAERRAAGLYLGGARYNSVLRDSAESGKEIHPHFQEQIDTLTGFIEKQPEFGQDTKLYRGMSAKFLPDAENRIGDVVTEPAFLSTSLKRDQAELFSGTGGGVLMEITARPQDKGLSVNVAQMQDQSDIPEEYRAPTDVTAREAEILMKPGTSMRITGVEDVNGTKVVRAEIVDAPSDKEDAEIIPEEAEAPEAVAPPSGGWVDNLEGEDRQKVDEALRDMDIAISTGDGEMFDKALADAEAVKEKTTSPAGESTGATSETDLVPQNTTRPENWIKGVIPYYMSKEQFDNSEAGTKITKYEGKTKGESFTKNGDGTWTRTSPSGTSLGNLTSGQMVAHFKQEGVHDGNYNMTAKDYSGDLMVDPYKMGRPEHGEALPYGSHENVFFQRDMGRDLPVGTEVTLTSVKSNAYGKTPENGTVFKKVTPTQWEGTKPDGSDYHYSPTQLVTNGQLEKISEEFDGRFKVDVPAERPEEFTPNYPETFGDSPFGGGHRRMFNTKDDILHDVRSSKDGVSASGLKLGDKFILNDGRRGTYNGATTSSWSFKFLPEGSKKKAGESVQTSEIAEAWRPEKHILVSDPAANPFGDEFGPVNFDVQKDATGQVKFGDKVVFGTKKIQGTVMDFNKKGFQVARDGLQGKSSRKTDWLDYSQVQGVYRKGLPNEPYNGKEESASDWTGKVMGTPMPNSGNASAPAVDETPEVDATPKATAPEVPEASVEDVPEIPEESSDPELNSRGLTEAEEDEWQQAEIDADVEARAGDSDGVQMYKDKADAILQRGQARLNGVESTPEEAPEEVSEEAAPAAEPESDTIDISPEDQSRLDELNRAMEAAVEADDVEAFDKASDAYQDLMDVIAQKNKGTYVDPDEEEEAWVNPLDAMDIVRRTPEAIEGEKYPPTQQQQDVIDAVLAGLDTKVQAMAGTGKTSTLVALSRRLTKEGKSAIYIAFNKTVQEEAEERMKGLLVEAKTGHGTAHTWARTNMPHLTTRLSNKDPMQPIKFDKKTNQATDWADRKPVSSSREIANILGIENNDIHEESGIPLSKSTVVLAVKKTVGSFQLSDKDEILPEHVPDSFEIAEADKPKIVEFANAYWDDLSREDGVFRMEHDTYRKHWALSRPDLTDGTGGNTAGASVLYIDEAQDTPPVLAKVVADQKMQKVIVGDQNQAIYAFAENIDYLSEADGDVELPLDKSWRFGPQVADIGNRFLQMLDSDSRVVGGGPESKIVYGMEDADAVLVRTNAGMIQVILEETKRGRKVAAPAGTRADLIRMADTVENLRNDWPGENPHDDLLGFKNWNDVMAAHENGDRSVSKIVSMFDEGSAIKRGMIKDYPKFLAEQMSNVRKAIDSLVMEIPEYQNIKMVKEGNRTYLEGADSLKGNKKQYASYDFSVALGKMKYPYAAKPSMSFMEKKKAYHEAGGIGTEGWRFDSRSKRYYTDSEEVANSLLKYSGEGDVVVSTAHKSKGLEWDRVRISDDFRAPYEDKSGAMVWPEDDEYKLAYVAVTRAAKELDPGILDYVFAHTQENGGNPKKKKSTEDSAPAPEQIEEEAAPTNIPDEVAAEETDIPEPEAPEPESDPEPVVEAPAPVAEPEPEVAPAPVAPAPEPEPQEEPIITAEPVDAPEPVSEPEPQAPVPAPAPTPAPEFDDEGLTPAERRRANELERWINEVYRFGKAGNVEKMENELFDLLQRGEKRMDPAPEAPVGPPAARQTNSTPKNRAPRGTYTDTPLMDTSGKQIQMGDIIGHPRLGPVAVTGFVPHSGRVTFIDPVTGKEASVKAAIVTIVNPDLDEEITEIVGQPGERFTDPATGKKAFYNGDGEPIVTGQRVVDPRTGRTGVVVSVYPGADGLASVPVQWDDAPKPAKPTRVKGILLKHAGV